VSRDHMYLIMFYVCFIVVYHLEFLFNLFLSRVNSLNWFHAIFKIISFLTHMTKHEQMR